MNHARINLNPRAFTLIEVMVAMVAFAIILAAINGIFWGALKLRNRTVESIDAALPTEQAMAVIRNDLINIVPPGGQFFGAFQATSQGATATSSSSTASRSSSMSSGSSSSSLTAVGDLLPLSLPVQGQVSPQFYTTSGVVDDNTIWSDLQMVSYSLVAPTNRDFIGKDLIRSVTRNLLPVTQAETTQQPLLNGVESLFFYYSDGSQWKETWDTNIEVLKLPKAIKVQIALASEKRGRSSPPSLELIVPLVDAGTNATATTTQ